MKNYFLLFVFTLFFSLKLFSQAKPIEQVSFDRFTTETQYSSDNMDFVEMIWWLPTEFWKIIYANDPSFGQEEVDEIVSLVDNYLIAIVIKGKIGMFGGVNYESYEDLKSHVQVKYNNEFLKIIDHGSLDTDLQNLLSFMKPVLANMMGNMGQNLHFFVFENPDNKKVLPVNPISNDYLLFSMDGFSADADLPIASLLLEKICPEDKAQLNGKWNYCPFHGKRLVSQ